MAVLDTFLKMQQRVAEDCGVNLTDTLTKIKDSINESGEDFTLERSWQWRRKEAFLILVAEHSTGTIGVTKDSAAVTGNAAAFTAAMVGRKLATGYNQPWYKILSVADGDNLTLDRVYQGATTDPLSYIIYQDEYQLPAAVEQLLPKKVWLHDSNGHRLCKMSETDSEGISRGTGRPYTYAKVGGDGSDQLSLRIGQYAPDAVYQIRYKYLTAWTALSDNTDVPDAPLRHREIICQGAVYRVYRLPQFRGSGLSAQAEAEYQRMVLKAKSNIRVPGGRTKIHLPNTRSVRPWAHEVYEE